MNRLRPRAALPAAALAAALTAGLAAHPMPASALPPHDWSYPFCGPQPAINAVYDHEYPTYACPPNGGAGCRGDNDRLRLYNDTVNDALAYEGHNGWDYGTVTQSGTNIKRFVLAVDDGVVSAAGWYLPGNPNAASCSAQVINHEKGYGLYVRIDHGGTESLYAHLSSIHVAVGDRVGRHQLIGTSGNTGNSTGPHLHFGAFRPHGPSYDDSFDPYGWNADWTGRADEPLPNSRDPWYQHSGQVSERMMLPGAHDAVRCPALCPPVVVVDDEDPGFALGCEHPPCRKWRSANVGHEGHLWHAPANGATLDHWASWQANLPPGTYQVDAFVPAGGGFSRSHAVRFRVGTGPSARDIVVDMHEEQQVWVSLGVHTFSTKPVVRVLDVVDIPGNWRYAGPCRSVVADAVRFVTICPSSQFPIVDPG